MRYIRNPAITETPLDGEIFLVDPEHDAVFYLDEVSSGLWRLLGGPITLAGLQSAYREAFPDSDDRIIDRDIETAIEDMKTRGLVVVFDRGG